MIIKFDKKYRNIILSANSWYHNFSDCFLSTTPDQRATWEKVFLEFWFDINNVVKDSYHFVQEMREDMLFDLKYKPRI